MPKPTVKKPTSSPKAPFKFKRHLGAPLIGVLVFLTVLGILNSQWIVAQAQYRFQKPVDSSSIVISTSSPSDITQPTIQIPKLRATAPIVFVPSTNDDDIQAGLENGVVHFGASVKPGSHGNSVIFGHSSGLPWSSGKYKYIFTLLNKLMINDKIIIDNAGTRYIYTVTGSTVVTPDTISVLQQTNSYTLTLITCTPVGTNSKRLVVSARQISPVPPPSNSSKPPTLNTPITTIKLPR